MARVSSQTARINHEVVSNMLRYALLILMIHTSGCGDPTTSPLKPAMGPYATARQTIPSISTFRPVDVWYPTQNTANAKQTYYDLLLFKIPSTTSVQETPPLKQRFPLILFSHGWLGMRFQSWTLMEMLASHGYVVAATDHPSDDLFDHFLDEDLQINQINPVSRINDIITLHKAMTTALSERIDASQIVLMGHSLGADTIVHVAKYASEPFRSNIKALIALDGAGPIFLSHEVRKEITAPIAFFVAEDTWSYISPLNWSYPLSQTLGASDCIYSVHPGAQHLSYTNICDIVPAAQGAKLDQKWIDKLQAQAESTCTAHTTPSEVFQWTARISATFLETHLNDHSDGPQILDAEWKPALVEANSPVRFNLCQELLPPSDKELQ